MTIDNVIEARLESAGIPSEAVGHIGKAVSCVVNSMSNHEVIYALFEIRRGLLLCEQYWAGYIEGGKTLHHRE